MLRVTIVVDDINIGDLQKITQESCRSACRGSNL